MFMKQGPKRERKESGWGTGQKASEEIKGGPGSEGQPQYTCPKV